MLKIGLTGGIACGKTTVTLLFQEHNVPIIDADVIAHELVAVGQPALSSISELFGERVIKSDGSLNRAILRDIIFNNSEEKHKLERILHPLIHQTILNQVSLLTSPYCIICIPLLFETKWSHLVDRVLVIDCPIETQVSRLQQRDGMSLEVINSIISSQVSRSYRLDHADDLINNTNTQDVLAEDVKKLHNLYVTKSNC